MSRFLTIIVPVYKVEDCIQRCLKSISEQTYTNFECIVVDDGSPDNCGKLCDEFAATDSRFRVIHQENQGLSGARNTALAMAKGELVGFVDSDDWVEPVMYERMIGLLDEYDADIVMCDYRSEHGSGNVYSKAGVEVISGRSFTEKILKDEYGSQLWKFVYKTPLWDGIVSPARRHAQDMMILHKVTHKAKTVVVTDEKLYGYNDVRETNISNSKKNVVKNKLDRALAFFGRMDFAYENNYDEAIKENVINQAVGFAVNSFFDNSIKDEKYSADVKTIRAYFKKYKVQISKWVKRRDYRWRCKLISRSPSFYLGLYRAYIWIFRK